jgi:hypothetical protein
MPAKTSATRKGANFKFGSLEMELPVGSRRLFGLVACLIALAWGWNRYGSEAYREFVNPDAIPVNQVQHRQMSESLVHFDEEPEWEYTPHGGKLEVKHFASDECTVHIWHLRDANGNPILDERGNPRYVVQWVLHYERLFDVDPPRSDRTHRPSGMSQISDAQAWCGGQCYTPGTHPGYPSESYEQLDPYGCVIRLWWSYGDGCTYSQDANLCTGWYGPVVPRCCVH